jgi:hypothetical protein
MNLYQKSLNFIHLLRKDFALREAAYLAFSVPLTDGDKYALTMLVCVLGIVAVLMNAQAIDCGSIH